MTESRWLGALLREKFPAEEYALLYEVRDGTGFHGSRSADAIAVSLWPSRGLQIIGFEFKESRSDWLRELKDPAKAEAIASYCDRWFLVVRDEKIVQGNELPENWGLMAARGDKLRAVKEAKVLTPKPLDRIFVASMCRAAQKFSPGAKIVDEAVTKARNEWEKARADTSAREDEFQKRQMNELMQAVKEFQEKSGIDIGANRWRAGDVGEAVKRLLRNRGPSDDVNIAIDSLESALDTLRALAALPAISD